MLNMNDDTQIKLLDEVSELSLPETHFNRQPDTHHKRIVTKFAPLFALHMWVN